MEYTNFKKSLLIFTKYLPQQSNYQPCHIDKVNYEVARVSHIPFFLILPNLLMTYLPRNPVAPNTVATTPLKDDLPPGPALGK